MNLSIFKKKSLVVKSEEILSVLGNKSEALKVNSSSRYLGFIMTGTCVFDIKEEVKPQSSIEKINQEFLCNFLTNMILQSHFQLDSSKEDDQAESIIELEIFSIKKSSQISEMLVQIQNEDQSFKTHELSTFTINQDSSLIQQSFDNRLKVLTNIRKLGEIDLRNLKYFQTKGILDDYIIKGHFSVQYNILLFKLQQKQINQSQYNKVILPKLVNNLEEKHNNTQKDHSIKNLISQKNHSQILKNMPVKQINNEPENSSRQKHSKNSFAKARYSQEDIQSQVQLNNNLKSSENKQSNFKKLFSIFNQNRVQPAKDKLNSQNSYQINDSQDIIPESFNKMNDISKNEDKTMIIENETDQSSIGIAAQTKFGANINIAKEAYIRQTESNSFTQIKLIDQNLSAIDNPCDISQSKINML
ncbi:UNKNOWN [Stylonychia lemnae]|uniref:Uncharacterized protein n=1 Tax=Stylonychia lemnae TaxID=5949 RepID=A0A078AZC3_STYLE|nr:UNKNOWN [Stylonychia lemnae]|eukprot:CDW87790.1 UNKNOWN [Stylonychia lemnae]